MSQPHFRPAPPAAALIRLCACALAWTALDPAARAQGALADGAGLPPPVVMVTAQKRVEALQSVPMSVSVVDAQEIERSGATHVADLARQVPGLTVVSSGPGQNILIVRGVSSAAGNAGTVGYYLDDTPISASSNASLLSLRGLMDPSLLDVARVEVLRGPQGTLYGSSSMGGTVKYLSVQPSLERFSGRVGGDLSGTAGGALNASANAVLNVPLAEQRAAFRVAVYERRADGYITRLPVKPGDILAVGEGVARRRANVEHTRGAHLMFKLRLDPQSSVTASHYTQVTQLDAPFQIDQPPGSLDRLVQTRLVAEPSTQRSSISNVTVRKNFDTFALLSSTSYFHRSVAIDEDASKMLYYFLSPTPQTAVVAGGMHGDYINREWTQELRATTETSGPMQLIAGLFYHHVDAPLASAIPVPDGYNARFGTDFGSFFTGARQASVKETAVFGEAAYQLDAALSARLGLRAFRIAQGFAQQGDGVFNGGPSAVGGSSSDHGYTPKLNLSWQAGEALLAYATASKGYRAGGPNNPAPAALCGKEVAGLGLSESALRAFAPDRLWNYELGVKSDWLGRRLTLNAAVYTLDWSKLQQQIVLQCGFNITANFGSATGKGGELELAYRPSTAVTLRGALSYTDAVLGNDVPGTEAKRGDTLLDVPRWAGSASAQYTGAVGGRFQAYARMDLSYTGTANALYDRASPFYQRKGFGLLGLCVGWEPHGAAPAWRGAVYVDNLFNRIGATGLPVAISADLPNTRRVAVNRPRTIGITFQHGL